MLIRLAFAAYEQIFNEFGPKTSRNESVASSCTVVLLVYGWAMIAMLKELEIENVLLGAAMDFSR